MLSGELELEGGPPSRWLRPPGADTRSAGDLNNSVLFNSRRRKSKRKTPNLFRGKAMEPSFQRRLLSPSLTQRPQNLREEAALEDGGVVQGCPLHWDHSPKVSSTQQRPSTHKALMARGRKESQVPFDRRSRLRPATPGFRCSDL